MNFKGKFYIVSVVFSMCFSLFADQHPSVVVIGGGPAGLATAIEAKESGAAVTLVEKRDAHTRMQWIFLIDSSLKLLEKWKVSLPLMRTVDLGDGTRIGFVPIKHLEEELEKRSKELGIKKIQGEFIGFKSSHSATIAMQNREVHLPYDILVGADGTHSRVREALSIPSKDLGTAIGTSALIPHSTDGVETIDISPPIKKEGHFLRRMALPSASLIFTQSARPTDKALLQKLTKECSWNKEALALSGEKALILYDIEIHLQQATTFSDVNRSAILVGDAAATASFFQGQGANTALTTAELAGHFFRQLHGKDQAAYPTFNQSMKRATDDLINDSLFLFNP